MASRSRRGSLLVISNRAPYSVRRRARKTELVRTVGGLATTLDDTLRKRGGVWLAWSGDTVRGRATHGRSRGHMTRSLKAPGGEYKLRLLSLTDRQVHEYYHGFSNQTLWPLCHYFIDKATYSEDEWKTYQAVNRVFARAARDLVPQDGIAWVHDFHLALVPNMLRHYRSDAQIATFWHIPFPSASVLRVCPKAPEIIQGLLGSDLIGFHTSEYVRHFLHAAEALLGAQADSVRGEVTWHGHTTRVGAFPIGTEADVFASAGSDRRTVQAAKQIRDELGVEHVLLGVDRLDYTKGIVERLEAYEQFLEDHPEYIERICLLQISVPSREGVQEYRELHERIDYLVGRISGRFSTSGWSPIRYLYRGFSRKELVAFYRAADVLLVTPRRDGLNLVGLEFVATRADLDGVLVFSEFAGAAERVREAILVNPYDRASIVNAIRTAIRMRPKDRREAMKAMRDRVLEEDVNWWLDRFLQAAEAGMSSSSTPIRRLSRA